MTVVSIRLLAVGLVVTTSGLNGGLIWNFQIRLLVVAGGWLVNNI